MTEVTNADRVLFPEDGITKGAVVQHYADVGGRIFEHVAERPLTLVRYPKGIGAKGFFQKNLAKHYPAELIGRFEVPRRGGVTVHPVALRPESFAYLANQGTIEFHVPFANDRLVLDFDPPEGAADQARAAARAAKALLDELGAPSALLATGSKGFHVHVRVDDGQGVGRTAHELAAILVHRHPDLLTHEVLKEARGGRVLVDWMRNGWMSTVVAPFSLRARRGAPIAVPLPWESLEEAAPDGVRLSAPSPLDRSDVILELSVTAHAPLADAVHAMVEANGLELVYIDRFGRHRT